MGCAVVAAAIFDVICVAFIVVVSAAQKWLSRHVCVDVGAHVFMYA